MADYIKRTDVQDVLNSIVEEYLEDNSFQCNFAAQWWYRIGLWLGHIRRR